jgi:hypothetical protein
VTQIVSMSRALTGANHPRAPRYHPHLERGAVEVEGARLLARRELAEARKPLPDEGSGGREHEHVLGPLLGVAHGFILGALEGILSHGTT